MNQPTLSSATRHAGWACLILGLFAGFLCIPSVAFAETPTMATGLGEEGAPGFARVYGGAGARHTFAIKVDGTVWAWGQNTTGQLGLGDVADRTTPTQVTGLTGARQIVVGTSHSLAIKADGTVWAWGQNTLGQLGLGDTTQRNTPTQVTSLSGARQLVAGANHSAAIKADGTVWVWGTNTNGQLGLGDTTQRNSPVQLTGLTGTRQLALGGSHTIAIKGDGTVWSWGQNTYGQLGLGTTTQQTSPVQVTTLAGARNVSAAASHSMAIRADGTVWAWGYNIYGQLGLGDTTQRTSPTQVAALAGARQLGLGGYHSTAIKSDGTVWTWGYNLYGQLGFGDTTNRTTPTQVASLAGSRALSGVGLYHSAAVKADGTLWTWGYNSSGQLGFGDTANRSSPTQTTFSCGCGFVHVVSGGQSNFGIKADGTVWAWGLGNWGQLGLGDTSSRMVPTQVPALTGARSIALGWLTTYVIKSDGTVWAMGRNNSYQLGLGDTVDRTVPTQITSLTGARQIVAGNASAMAILANGTVWGWGNGGDIGIGDSLSRTTPAQVASLTGSRRLVMGFEHAGAIKSDGTVWMWGSNGSGQLGVGDTTNRTSPVQIVSLTGARTLTLGRDFSMAITSGGALQTWGANWSGELGLGDTTLRNTPTTVASMSGVRELGAGWNHALAAKADGTLWTWGKNTSGQLGLGDTTNRLSPTTIPTITGAYSAGGGYGHSVVSTTTGVVTTWGDGSSGQNGNGRTNLWSFPTGVDPCPAPPVAPTGLAQFRSDGVTTLATATWTNESTVVFKFDVQDPGPWQSLTPSVEVRTDTAWSATCGSWYNGSVVYQATPNSPTQGSVVVSGLTDSATYYWRACIRDQHGLLSPWSIHGGSPSFRIDANAPNAVTSLTAPTPTTSAPSLTWTTVSDIGPSGISYYRVFRGDAACSGMTKVSTDGAPTTGSYTDTGATAGSSYCYEVRAVDVAGNERAAGNNQVVVAYNVSSTLDGTGCPAQSFGIIGPNATAITSGDCTVRFGSASGTAQLRIYQQDGANPAMTGLDDYASGATDWDQGTSMFGACLRATTGAGAVVDAQTWTPDSATITDEPAASADCADADGDPWYPIQSTSTAAARILKSASGDTNVQAHLRFGIRTSGSQPAGAYSAPLVFEVVSPGV